MTRVTDIEIVEDRTASSRPDEGFLRVHRYRVRNVREDGSRSQIYSADVIVRWRIDAVAIALYDRTPEGKTEVLLRRCLRPPGRMRAELDTPLSAIETHPLFFWEIVAGVTEPDDVGADGLRARAVQEIFEETGYRVDPASIDRLGGGMFPTPGVAVEKVYLFCARIDRRSSQREEDHWSGELMEEGAELRWVELDAALEELRESDEADAKTEIALFRLRDRLQSEGASS